MAQTIRGAIRSQSSSQSADQQAGVLRFQVIHFTCTISYQVYTSVIPIKKTGMETLTVRDNSEGMVMRTFLCVPGVLKRFNFRQQYAGEDQHGNLISV